MKAFVSSRIPERWLKELGKRFEIDYCDWTIDGLLSEIELEKRIRNVNLIITESDNITREIINNNPDLFAIVDFRGTVVNVDIDEATKNGVVIINSPGRNADSVADLTVAFMVMLARNIVSAIDSVKNGIWHEEGKRWGYEKFQGYDLPGKTVGLLGLGHIGRLVAKRLAGYDVEILVYDPFVDEQLARNLNIAFVDFDTIFRLPDFLSLHLPLNDHTKNLIKYSDLAKMKTSAYLINTSRAAVVEEEGLIRILSEGLIAGAAFDVFHLEPVSKDYPLVKFPNVICTPHIGGASHDVVAHMSDIGLNGLFEFLNGSLPENIINPDAIQGSKRKLKELTENKR